MRLELIRTLRKEKGLTLVELGEKTGYTPSFLSQLERGLKQPSLDALRIITECLGVSLLALLENQTESSQDSGAQNYNCVIIRKDNRHKFVLEGERTQYEMLTPQSSSNPHKYSMYGTLVTVAPGVWTNISPVVHFYEESIYILSGKMRADVGGETYNLETGDSIYIAGFTPHNYFNPGDEPLITIAFQSK